MLILIPFYDLSLEGFQKYKVYKENQPFSGKSPEAQEEVVSVL